MKQIHDNSFDIKANDIKAKGRLNRLYVELLKDNPDWDRDNRHTDFNHFMARLIFCFFAEDTNILHSRGLFTQTIAQMSDGTNTHKVLAEIFLSGDGNTLGSAASRGDSQLDQRVSLREWVAV